MTAKLVALTLTFITACYAQAHSNSEQPNNCASLEQDCLDLVHEAAYERMQFKPKSAEQANIGTVERLKIDNYSLHCNTHDYVDNKAKERLWVQFVLLDNDSSPKYLRVNSGKVICDPPK